MTANMPTYIPEWQEFLGSRMEFEENPCFTVYQNSIWRLPCLTKL